MSTSRRLSHCCPSHQPENSRTIRSTVYISRTRRVYQRPETLSPPFSFPILSLFLSLPARLDGTSLRNFELAIYARGLRLLCLAATSIARIISISPPFKNRRHRRFPSLARVSGARCIRCAREFHFNFPRFALRFPGTFLSSCRIPEYGDNIQSVT